MPPFVRHRAVAAGVGDVDHRHRAAIRVRLRGMVVGGELAVSERADGEVQPAAQAHRLRRKAEHARQVLECVVGVVEVVLVLPGIHPLAEAHVGEVEGLLELQRRHVAPAARVAQAVALHAIQSRRHQRRLARHLIGFHLVDEEMADGGGLVFCIVAIPGHVIDAVRSTDDLVERSPSGALVGAHPVTPGEPDILAAEDEQLEPFRRVADACGATQRFGQRRDHVGVLLRRLEQELDALLPLHALRLVVVALAGEEFQDRAVALRFTARDVDPAHGAERSPRIQPFLERVQVVAQVIQPAVRAGRCVFCQRPFQQLRPRGDRFELGDHHRVVVALHLGAQLVEPPAQVGTGVLEFGHPLPGGRRAAFRRLHPGPGRVVADGITPAVGKGRFRLPVHGLHPPLLEGLQVFVGGTVAEGCRHGGGHGAPRVLPNVGLGRLGGARLRLEHQALEERFRQHHLAVLDQAADGPVLGRQVAVLLDQILGPGSNPVGEFRGRRIHEHLQVVVLVGAPGQDFRNVQRRREYRLLGPSPHCLLGLRLLLGVLLRLFGRPLCGFRFGRLFRSFRLGRLLVTVGNGFGRLLVRTLFSPRLGLGLGIEGRTDRVVVLQAGDAPHAVVLLLGVKGRAPAKFLDGLIIERPSTRRHHATLVHGPACPIA